METINLTSVKKEFLVEASQQTAFEVFTQKMDSWWPRKHHIGSSDMTEVIAELHEGGRWYTKHIDGSEAPIGYVQTYQPYDLFVLVWQINGDFKCDLNMSTEVVAEFIPEGLKTTRVKFEHKDLHKLGNGKVVDSMDEGWGQIMNLYKQFAEQ